MKFIYVFGESGKQTMLDKGYELLKSNENTDCHIFLNRKDMVFENIGVRCVLSDVLTF